MELNDFQPKEVVFYSQHFITTFVNGIQIKKNEKEAYFKLKILLFITSIGVSQCLIGKGYKIYMPVETEYTKYGT